MRATAHGQTRRRLLHNASAAEERTSGALRPRETAGLTSALDGVLAEAIEASGADAGHIQLLEPGTGALEIVSQRGFGPDFLEHFRSVRTGDGSAGARAMASGERVIIEDVERDASYARHREIAASNGYRSVISTPVLSHAGALLGMLSVYFQQPGARPAPDLRLLDLCARVAAGLIERVRLEHALGDADRRRNEFLAVLAHELRNPLAPILNAVQIVKEKTHDDPDASWSQAVIERQVAQMAHLLDDLLDVNRLMRDRLELRRSIVSLSTVVNDALETTRPVLEQGQHRLTITLPDHGVFLDADPVRLSQVFANLLSNAARYTPTGGRIDLSSWVEDAGDGTDEVVVSVRDSGIGIDRQTLPHVFEMFAKAEGGAGRLQGGLGIGLSLARGLIEMHGGRIEALSEGLGRGSEFVVRVPAARAVEEPDISPPRDDGEVAPVRRHRLLIVDDVADTADSLAAVMRARGHEVHTAYDGAEAVSAAERHRPEAVVLDLGMPTLTGYDAARLIRKAPWGRDMILIAVTGWGQERDRRRTRAAGFDRHLVKPVHPDTLLEVLGSLDAARKTP